MNKRFFTLIMVFVLVATTASAQIKKADKLFKSFSYSQAIPYYLKVTQKKGSLERNEAIFRLADCYRLTNDQPNAEKWYAQAVKLPGSDPINWFYLGQALSCAQEYTGAKEAYDKYAELVPADPRGKAHSAFVSQINKLTDMPAVFEVKNARNLNSDRSDFGPAFYNKGIVYVSDRRQNFMDGKRYGWTNSDYLDLFFSTPLTPDEFYADMNAPQSFAGEFNQTYHDGPAAFARHDSLIYFTRTQKGHEKKDADNFRTNRLKIYWASYDGSWSKAEPFAFNSDAYSVGQPSLSADGKMIYFVSDMPGGLGGTDIYSCTWTNNAWSPAKNLGAAVNSFGDEMFPFINGDKLYFSSDGWPGFGGLDIFCSTSANGTWSNPENQTLPMNSSYDDFSLALDITGQKGFFSSGRPGGIGIDDIYACNRLEVKEKPKPILAANDASAISGYVKDKQTLKPMAGSTVFLLDTLAGKVKILKTDANGQYSSPVKKGTFYKVKGMENNFLADCIGFQVALDDTAHKANASRDLLLDMLAVNKVFTMDSKTSNIANIYYDFSKWDIRPEAERALIKLIQIMKESPINIELGSHTDCRGDAEYNMFLSQKRAETVVSFIVQHGIEVVRITAKGYGESELTNQCSDGVSCTHAEHQANRRTEFKVTEFKTTATDSGTGMKKYNEGDVIPVSMFESNFFINCFAPN